MEDREEGIREDLRVKKFWWIDDLRYLLSVIDSLRSEIEDMKVYEKELEEELRGVIKERDELKQTADRWKGRALRAEEGEAEEINKRLTEIEK